MKQRTHFITFLLVGLVVGMTLSWAFFTFNQAQPTLSIDMETPLTEAQYYQVLGYALHDPTTHGFVETDPAQPIPTVEFQLQKDAMSGYNLTIVTENFTFTPQNASELTQVNNEGHAHLLINGYKIDRLYGPNYHLKSNLLQLGDNEVTVTLNANDHADWLYEGDPIQATETVNQSTEDEGMMMEM